MLDYDRILPLQTTKQFDSGRELACKRCLQTRTVMIERVVIICETPKAPRTMCGANLFVLVFRCILYLNSWRNSHHLRLPERHIDCI